MNQKPPPYSYGTGGEGVPPSSSDTTIGRLSARAKQTTLSTITTLRPWRELLDLSALSLPRRFVEAMAQLRRNLNYFRANYALAVLAIVFLRLLYHPISMVVFFVVFTGWILLYFSRDTNGPIVNSEKEVDDRIVLGLLMGLLSLVTILALMYTDVGENALAPLIIGLLIVGAHAASRSTDDLFLDEETARRGWLAGNRPRSSYNPI